MIIGGLEKLSLIDYPDCLSAIVFTVGCNFRCRFCYNPLLVLPPTAGETDKYQKSLPKLCEADFFAFLKSRLGKLEAVVITGGEPTLQADLPNFIKKIKDLGYKVKLDTNGTNPTMVKKLITAELLDYIAMDYKAPLADYAKIVGVKIKAEKIKETMALIKQAGLPYEFRSTIAPSLHSADDLRLMARELGAVEKWYLQALVSDANLVDKTMQGQKAYARRELSELIKELAGVTGHCELRGY